jgi:hypothetical protein
MKSFPSAKRLKFKDKIKVRGDRSLTKAKNVKKITENINRISWEAEVHIIL